MILLLGDIVENDYGVLKYMSWLEIFLIGLGLSMDACAVSICKGLSIKKVKLEHMITAGLWFGFFQGLMPLIGFFGGKVFAESVDKYDHWIAFILLLLIGVNLVKESFGDEEDVKDDMGVVTMFMAAIATSIDALAVGVTFAFMNINISHELIPCPCL